MQVCPHDAHVCDALLVVKNPRYARREHVAGRKYIAGLNVAVRLRIVYYPIPLNYTYVVRRV